MTRLGAVTVLALLAVARSAIAQAQPTGEAPPSTFGQGPALPGSTGTAAPGLPNQTAQPSGRGGGPPVSQNGVDVWANIVWYQEERHAMVMSEGVRAEYQGTTITADRCDYDTDEKVALFYPYVVIEREDERLVAERCLFRFDDRTWTIWNATAELAPKFLANWTTDFVYVHADRIEGDDELARLFDVYVTTCPFARMVRPTETGEPAPERLPDYRIKAKHGKISQRGNWISLGPSVVYLGRVPVFWLPGWGLRRQWLQRLDTVPQIGTNSSEGWYFRWSYRYIDRNFIKLALTQRQGNTYGADWAYRSDDGRTSFDVDANYRTKTNSFTGSANLRAPLLGGDLSAGYNLSRTSALVSGTSTTENSRFTYSNRGGWGELSINANQNITTTTQRRGNTSADARYSYSFSGTTRLDASMSYSSNDTTVTGGDPNALIANQEIFTRLSFSSRQPFADWELRYEKRQDPDGNRYTGDNNFGYTERLPELHVRTDMRRIGLSSPVWSASIDATAGYLREPGTGAEQMRYALDLSGSRKPIKMGSTTINISPSYRQRWYADNTALYALGGRIGIQSKWSGVMSSRIDYSLNDTAGYSPFRFDTMSDMHAIAGSLEWLNRTDRHNRRATLSTNYDFGFKRWSDLRLNYSWSGYPGNQITLSGNYSLEQGKMGLVSMRYNKRRAGWYDWQLQGGYDFRSGKLQTIRSQLDWEIEKGHWRLRWFSTYNTQRRKFDQNNIQLIRYTHCFTYGLSYNAQRNDWRFQIQVRGLPSFMDDSFSVGGQGEFTSPTTGGGGDSF